MARSLTQSGTDRQNRMILIGAIGLALLAAVLVFVSLSKFGESGSPTAALGKTQDVVVASQDINAGTKITAGMLSISTLPINAVVDGAITDKTGLAGLTPRYPLAKGDQFSAVKLGLATTDKSLAGVVPAGKRAVAVEITENTSVGGLIIAGNHVDVIAVLKSSSGSGATQDSRAVTLLQDVEVLSVAQNAQKATARLDSTGKLIQTDTASGAIAASPDNTDPTPKARTVTLAVNPDEAPLLALAQDQGKVWLSLRGSGDKDTPNIAPRTLPSQ